MINSLMMMMMLEMVINHEYGDDLFSMGKTIPMPSKAKMAVPKKSGNLSVKRLL